MNYSQNHFIPRFILKKWASGSPEGVFVYEILTESKSFSPIAEDFPFAKISELYIPIINRVRHTNFEVWLNRQETALANFIKTLSVAETKTVTRTTREYIMAVSAIVSMKQRSRHDLDKISDLLQETPEVRRLVSVDPTRGFKQIALENIVNATLELTQRITPADISVYRSTNSNFILCDRPVLRLDEFFMFAVDKSTLLVMSKAEAQDPVINYFTAENDFVNDINRQLVMNARDWIVADTEVLLEKHIQIACSPDWKESLQKEDFTFIKYSNLDMSFSFEKD